MSLVSLLITILIVGLILGLVIWAIREMPIIPEPFKKVAIVVVLLIAIIILLSYLGPHAGWRLP